jgi:hypothetical protein
VTPSRVRLESDTYTSAPRFAEPLVRLPPVIAPVVPLTETAPPRAARLVVNVLEVTARFIPGRPPLVTWRAHANLLYANWLNYHVYQETPYNLSEIR